MYWSLTVKIPIFPKLVPIWHTLGPSLSSLLSLGTNVIFLHYTGWLSRCKVGENSFKGWHTQVSAAFTADPPENCHLNDEKIAENLTFKKKIAKNCLFKKIANGNFFLKKMKIFGNFDRKFRMKFDILRKMKTWHLLILLQIKTILKNRETRILWRGMRQIIQ